MSNTYSRGLLVGVTVGAVLAASGGWLWAQGKSSGPVGGTGKIACVDIGKVFLEYQRKKDLDDEMKTKQDQLQSENEKRRQSIDSAQAVVDRMDTKDPTYVSRMREVLQMQIEYKNWVDLMQADIARETGVWTANIYREMLDTIKEISEREGIDLVFFRDEFDPKRTGYEPDAVRNEIRARKLVYWNPSIDITTRISDRLNETYRKQPQTKMLQMAPGAISASPTPAPAGGNPQPPQQHQPGKKP